MRTSDGSSTTKLAIILETQRTDQHRIGQHMDYLRKKGYIPAKGATVYSANEYWSD